MYLLCITSVQFQLQTLCSNRLIYHKRCLIIAESIGDCLVEGPIRGRVEGAGFYAVARWSTPFKSHEGRGAHKLVLQVPVFRFHHFYR